AVIPGISDVDGPTARLVRRVTHSIDAAAGGRDEHVAQTSCSQDLDHAIDRVALSNSTRIDLDARTIELDWALVRVELNVLVPGAFECVAEFVSGRNVMCPTKKSPGTHERADGQIEGAFAGAAVVEAIG